MFLEAYLQQFVQLSKILTLGAVGITLVPSAIGVRYWKRFSPALKYTTVFALLPGLLLGIASEIGRWIFHNNLAVISFAGIIEQVCLAGIYLHTLTSPRLRVWIIISMVAFLLISSYETVQSLQQNLALTKYSHLAQAMLSIGFVIGYFEQLLRELPSVQLEKHPLFLISVGICLYYAGTIMVFVLEPHLLQQPLQLWAIYLVQSSLYIVLNIFLAFALYYASRPQPQRWVWYSV